MLNPYITLAPNILFLGAGASKPLGKMLMGEFIDHLKDDGNVSKYPLFHDIVRIKNDLEELLQELEEFAGKDYFGPKRLNLLLGPSPKSKNLLSPIVSPPSPPELPQETKAILMGLSSDATAIQRAVKQAVFNHYRSFEDESKIKPLFEPLFRQVFTGNTGAIVIFTTNYDPAVERFCDLAKDYICIDGFADDPGRGRYTWSSNNYDNFSARSDRKPVFLFKLHGSTDWIRHGDAIVHSAPTYADNDASISNVMIYPATRKVADEEPFFTCYNYLQACLSKAKYCLFVGYSFRDYDALARIRAAFSENPDLRIEVIDPNAKVLAQTLLAFGIRAKPHEVYLEVGKSLPLLLALKSS